MESVVSVVLGLATTWRFWFVVIGEDADFIGFQQSAEIAVEEVDVVFVLRNIAFMKSAEGVNLASQPSTTGLSHS